MPKAGFKSITVSENIYDKFYKKYEKKKKILAMKGINSFSGYMVSILAKQLEESWWETNTGYQEPTKTEL